MSTVLTISFARAPSLALARIVALGATLAATACGGGTKRVRETTPAPTGPGSADGAPPGGAAGTADVDATALVSPIVLTLEWHQMPPRVPDDEASPAALRLRLVDANGAEQVVELGLYTTLQDRPIELVEPASESGPSYFQERRFFAGAGDNFDVVRDPYDTIIVSYQATDEEVGEGPWTELARIRLAPGAVVRAAATRP